MAFYNYVLKYAKYFFNIKKKSRLNLFFIDLVLNTFNLINFTMKTNNYNLYYIIQSDINRCHWIICVISTKNFQYVQYF